MSGYHDHLGRPTSEWSFAARMTEELEAQRRVSAQEHESAGQLNLNDERIAANKRLTEAATTHLREAADFLMAPIVITGIQQNNEPHIDRGYN